MEAQPTKSVSFIILLAILVLLVSSACGVFEIGIERTATPESGTPVAPTDTVTPPSPTPFVNQLKPGQAVRVVEIHMQNITNGWAIGQADTDLNDHILYTADGGHTWQDRTPPEALANAPAGGLAALAYFGADGNTWVTYANHLPSNPPPEKQVFWFTNDIGQSWQKVGDLDTTGFQAEYFTPSDLGFLDGQHGWFMAHVGAGMSHDYIAAYITSDGGKTWTRVIDQLNNPELMPCAKTGFAFSTVSNGWLVGDCPGLMNKLFFYSSFDGGQTWQETTLPPPNSQPADLFTSGNAACGIPDLVYLTARTTYMTVRCEFFASRQTASWLYAGATGNTMESRALPLPFGDVQFVDANLGWMIGSEKNDPAAEGEIYHTTDGGLTWKLVIATGWQGMPNFVDANAGWVVARQADKTALVFSSDGGVMWEALTPVIGK